MTLGAPAQCGDRRDGAQMSEGRFGAEPVDATPQAAQRWVGGLGGIGEAVGVGPQSGAHGGGALQGAAGVEEMDDETAVLKGLAA